MKLYEPINTLKPVGDDLWIVDGPIVRMATGVGFTLPFPTRMVVVRLDNGTLFLWSPTEPDDGLRAQIDALGPVAHLVSPNRIHYAHIAAWKRAYPAAVAWASPGVRERAASQKIDVAFDANLGAEPDAAWAADIDQIIFRGSRFMEEVVFFHRKTKTVILADLIENFEPDKIGGAWSWIGRLAGVVDPDGKTPVDFRLTFFGRKADARDSVARMLAWEPRQLIMAHGRPYRDDGTAELRRAFRWVHAPT